MKNQLRHYLNRFPRDLGRKRRSPCRTGRNRRSWHWLRGPGPSQHSLTKQNGWARRCPGLVRRVDEVGTQGFVRCPRYRREPKTLSPATRFFFAPRQSPLQAPPVDGQGKTFLNGFDALNGGELGF